MARHAARFQRFGDRAPNFRLFGDAPQPSSAFFGIHRKTRIALAALLLTFGGTWQSQAIIVPGDDPPPTSCANDISGTLNADPRMVDLTSGARPNTMLTWSVSKPTPCSNLLRIEINGTHVGLYGQKEFNLPRRSTNRFELVALFSSGNRLTLAAVDVTLTPGPVTLSPGRALAAIDVKQFDDLWMHKSAREEMLRALEYYLQSHDLSASWGAGARAVAMGRMYELTRNRAYLDHMREIIDLALKYRDDRVPGTPNDAFRPHYNRPIAGWGGESPESAFFWRTDVDTSAVYAQPMAMYARIVFEDNTLLAQHAAAAVIHANAAFETFRDYLPDWTTRPSDNGLEMTLVGTPAVRTLLTPAACSNAFSRAVAEQWHNLSADQLDEIRKKCEAGRNAVGDVPHNGNHLMAMLAIELERAVTNPLYQAMPGRLVSTAQVSQIPWMIERNQRYFLNAMYLTHTRGIADLPFTAWGPARFWWYYIGRSNSHPEDARHAAVSINYLDVLMNNHQRLNTKLAPSGASIWLSADDKARFANTFIYNMYRDGHLADVVGVQEEPRDLRDDAVEGWVFLSRVDSRVFEACAAITLRTDLNLQQPWLSVSSHAALLVNKAYRP